MKLTALRLHNVRRFGGRGIAIEGIGDGVNVLCAVNEYGKSTCFDALHALFFQIHTGTPGAVQSLRPYSGGSPRVEADIETSDGRYRLSKQFYAGRHARVTDMASGRLIAQADEAERFISARVRGGASGPAGLLWVRQGITGLEKRSRSDEESEKQAREGVLSSVQGEVEVLTGGRRMVEAMEACQEELSRLVTPTGRAKAGGPYEAAILHRDRLAEEERRLEAEVKELRTALDARRRARARLAELDDAEEARLRATRAEEAQAALQAARSHGEALSSAQARAELLRSRRDEAVRELETYRGALERASVLRKQYGIAAETRRQAEERRRRLRGEAEAASQAVEAAEGEEQQARDLLGRLDRAMRAREAAERKAALGERMEAAEAARTEIETGQARARGLAVPPECLQALEAVENDLVGLRATTAARLPSISISYAPGAAGSMLLDGEAMDEGADYPVRGTIAVRVGDLGTLTVSPGRQDNVEDALDAAEQRRRGLLERIGAASLAEARQRNVDAERAKSKVELARQRLALLAPDGLDALRGELARAERESGGDRGIEGDPEAVREALESAGGKVTQSRNAVREFWPMIEQADTAAVDAEKALAAIGGELERTDALLGPEPERQSRETALASGASDAVALLEPVEEEVDRLRKSAPDLDTAEAALKRAQSVVDAASKETARLREEIADLNGRISARSQEAIEEAWRETVEKHAEARAVVGRLDREVAVLQRLRAALERSRADARDHFFEPVLRELRPLLGLLFDDASVVFDDATLLPQTVQRDGQIEAVDRLSGGMREQLAVLTRLAFARLLASEGQPTPVILDDALVYSDDDRIERMFDALHRQGHDQQILVFSCRQRAFASLGGTMLHMTDWSPRDE